MNSLNNQQQEVQLPPQGPQPPVKRTFYKRPLPDACIGLSSKKGKQIFASAMSNKGLKSFFPLIEQFTTQSEPAYCGVSTLVLVLNALSVDPRMAWKGPWRWYEEQMLNCCLDLEEVKKTGITLRDFQCLAYCQGLSVDLNHCTEEVQLEQFRAAVRKACVEDETEDDNSTMDGSKSHDVLVVSYLRTVLGQTGSGHFSPVGAYDAASDSVLILDTARFKYGAHWVQLPLLFEAMKPIDPDTGKSRGYALLSFPKYEEEQRKQPCASVQCCNKTNTATTNSSKEAIICAPLPVVSPNDILKAPSPLSVSGSCSCSTQPMCLLLRSKMSQNPVRRKYREFLSNYQQENNNKLSWEDVLSYWTKNGRDSQYVWKIVEPMRPPPKDSVITSTIQKVTTFIQTMIPPNAFDETLKCQHLFGSVPCVQPRDAIFIVYLASLDATVREELVRNSASSSKVSTLTQDQLLCEAAMVAKAIHTSDQTNLEF